METKKVLNKVHDKKSKNTKGITCPIDTNSAEFYGNIILLKNEEKNYFENKYNQKSSSVDELKSVLLLRQSFLFKNYEREHFERLYSNKKCDNKTKDISMLTTYVNTVTNNLKELDDDGIVKLYNNIFSDI